MNDSISEPRDVEARIAGLWVYPVKSCAGVALESALLTDTGLDLDRSWMVVDEQGRFVTQRDLPRMALVRPQLRSTDVVLRAPGMLALHLAMNEVEQPTRVRVWDDELPAYDMGPVAAQWFTDFLVGAAAEGRVPPGWTGRRLRLVRFDPQQRRLSSLKWTGGVEAPNQFNDGFAVLLASTASLEGLNARLAAAGHAPVGMERFRPNLILEGLDAHDEDRLDTLHIDTREGEVRLQPCKPCARCPIPDVDPATAQCGTAVRDALQGYRQSTLLGGAVTFGMNAFVRSGDGLTLRVGQAVRADWRFD